MRTRKTVIVLISGKAFAGKSTVGEKLAKGLKDKFGMDIMEYGFADPIKYIAKSFAGWNGEKDEKGRKLLQDIGRIFREYDEDIWVKHFLNQLDKKSGILPKNFAIIDDWRFPNELNYLKKNPILDVVTIRVFGRGGLNGELSSDVSENSLPEATRESLGNCTLDILEPIDYYDFSIENKEDMDVLEHKLEVILAELQKQYIVK